MQTLQYRIIWVSGLISANHNKGRIQASRLNLASFFTFMGLQDIMKEIYIVGHLVPPVQFLEPPYNKSVAAKSLKYGIQDLCAASENTVSGVAPLSWHWEFCRQLYAPLAGCIQPAQTKSLVHLNQLIARQNLSRSVQFCELIPTEHMTRLYSKLTIPHSYVSSRFQTPSLVLSLLWRRFGLAPLDNTDISQLRSRRCAGALWETQQTYATGG